ncbi:MAG: hypothetical protein ACKO3W_12690 [bacterium]
MGLWFRPCSLRIALVALTSPMWCGAITASLAGTLSADARAQYGPVDPYDSALRALRESIGSTNDGEQHAGMVALRELCDPTLKPLFERLLKSDDWTLRVDSVLGLAELDVSRKIDPALVSALPGEVDRETAIAAAVSLRMLNVDRVTSMLTWDDLPQPQRLLLACELRKLGGAPDAALLAKLAESRTPEVATLATAMLLDLATAGSDAATAAEAAADRARKALADLPPKTRSAIVAQTCEACSVNQLRGAAAYCASLIVLPDVADDARLRAIGSLLVLAPDSAYPVVAARVDADRSQTSLMRHAAVLLASGARAPKSEWDRLRNGDVLIEGLADAGTLFGEGRDDEAYAKLLELKHRVALRAATEGALRVGGSSERALGIASARYLAKERRAAAPLAESLTRSIARLAAVAPEELAGTLAEIEEERSIQETVLLALASAGTLEASKTALAAKGRTSRTGEAMIAVLEARHANSCDESTLRELATIAGGGASVSSVIRTQAAWLWLRHAGRTADAIEALTARSATASPAVKESTP